jgi:hypothetical protein
MTSRERRRPAGRWLNATIYRQNTRFKPSIKRLQQRAAETANAAYFLRPQSALQADAAGIIGFIALWYDTLSKFIRGHLCTPTVFADSGFSS